MTTIELTGHKVTKDYVEGDIQTQAVAPLVLDTVAADLQPLEDLSIFAQVRVEAERPNR